MEVTSGTGHRMVNSTTRKCTLLCASMPILTVSQAVQFSWRHLTSFLRQVRKIQFHPADPRLTSAKNNMTSSSMGQLPLRSVCPCALTIL